MRRVTFQISEELFKQALHMDRDLDIQSISYAYPNLTVVADLEVPTPAVEPLEITVNPVIHYEPEKYTWDWGFCPHGYRDSDKCPDCCH